MENLEYGGVTTHLINLINSKQFMNNEFIIITNKSNKAVKQITKNIKNRKITFQFYNSYNLLSSKNFIIKIFLIILKPVFFLLSINQMCRILKNLKFDILLANCGGYGNFRDEMASVIASKILKKNNTYMLIHNCYMPPILWKNLINIFNIYVAKYSKCLIFVSHATKKSIGQNTNLIKFSAKNFVVHNGVKLKKFKTRNLKIFNTKKGVYKIGMLARIEGYKGQIDLVNAFSKLSPKLQKKFKVFFVGNGEKEELKLLVDLINKKNLKNTFKVIKFINEENLLILKNFDLLISLTRDFEGFGYSIAEALYVQTPVIATKVGGVGEFLNLPLVNSG